MNLSSLLPPSDLLEKTEGVESGLRQRKRLGTLGWYGFLVVSAAEILLEIADKGIVARLLKAMTSDAVLAQWPYLLLAAAGVLFLLLGTWSTFWLQESRQPFRYTCSIAPFVPVRTASAKYPASVDEAMTWLPHDITRLLNERVQRFLFTDEAKKDAPAKSSESHLHIHGHYVVREQPGEGGQLEIEVMPRVRIGPEGSAEVMAQSTLFAVRVESEECKLKRDQYGDLLEQVYHSVVSELYRRLKEDVQRKIELLPTSRFKAIALLHEADDYARSNTLHAYEEARELYRQAAAALDPRWRKPRRSRFLRTLWRAGCAIHAARVWLRRLECHFRPRAGEEDLIGARALTGYAKMLIFRRVLAGLVGQSVNPIFEARPVAERALATIESLNEDVPERVRALFDARVTLALARFYMQDVLTARHYLEAARAVSPRLADVHPVFIYASGVMAVDQRARLGLLRRSLELAPRFEVAQFNLAQETESLWRSRPSLESGVADLVIQEYRKLLQINPGNVGGWANLGYVSWLLGTTQLVDDAIVYFEQGLRLKRMRKDVYVSELDYGLARIYAERGDFARAYNHYVSAIAALLARESDRSDYRFYYFESMTDGIEARFRRYHINVETAIRLQRKKKDGADAAAAREQWRIRQSIRAFAINDLGEAYVYASLSDASRGSDETRRARRVRKAVAAFRRSIRRNETFVLPYFNLGQLGDGWASRGSLDYLKRVLELQPRWPLGQIALVRRYATAAPDALAEQAKADEARARKQAAEEELLRLDAQSASDVDRRRTVERALSAGSAAQPSSSTTSREEVEARIADLEKQVQEHRRNAEEKARLAERYRDDARRLARTLLPHEWLWTGEELERSRLSDPAFRAELRWEREFNDLQVEALYAWTLRFANDRTQAERAIEFLTHIRQHYWPANAELLATLLPLQLESAGEDVKRKRRYVSEALGANPTVISIPHLTRLEEYGFSLDETIELLAKAIAFDPISPDVPALRKRLAAAYAEKAEKEKDPRDAAAWQRKALEADPKNAYRAVALAEALEKAAEGGDESLLDEAIHAAGETVRLNREEPEYAERAARLSIKKKNLAHRRELVNRFGPGAGALLRLEKPLVVRYSRDLAPVFEFAPGSDAAKAFDSSLETLRYGLLIELGIQLLTPELRRDPTGENRYTVVFSGVEVASRELRADRWLCGALPEDLKAAGIEAEEAVNPANGNRAAWVKEADLEKARAFVAEHDAYLGSPVDYVILHLFGILRRNAAELLRVDEVVRLLKSWNLGAEAVRLQRDGLLLEFTNVLRALIAGDFRIVYPSRIIQAFRNAYQPARSLTVVVEQIRGDIDVRKENRCNRATDGVTLIRVGRLFERAVADGVATGRGAVLALAPEQTQELLTTVRELVTGLDPALPYPMLLCRSEMRPWIRKLLEIEFPNFPVVSEAEVLPEHLARVTATLDIERTPSS